MSRELTGLETAEIDQIRTMFRRTSTASVSASPQKWAPRPEGQHPKGEEAKYPRWVRLRG